MRTLNETRTRIKNDTRETQLTDATLNDYINLTLQEINDPAWATKGYNHLWSFNRRKATFATVASTEFYQLPRDLDKISLIRQTTSPIKVKYIPDEIFYRFIPNPTATGNPIYYRLWEEEGVSTRLSTDDMVKVVSSSTSDGSSFTVSVVGYDTNGLIQSEVITLNGTTTVNGTITFDAGRSLRISKSGKTTGSITVSEKTTGTTLVILAPEDRSPRFKVVGLYPIPSSAITISLEYYTRIRLLVNDTDVPDIDEKWLWVVRLGAMAKIYQYQPKEQMFRDTQTLFKNGVESMVKADMQEPDYIPHLRSRRQGRIGKIELGDENYVLNF